MKATFIKNQMVTFLNASLPGRSRKVGKSASIPQRLPSEMSMLSTDSVDGANAGNLALPFDIIFADKKTNLAGLQLADLVARLIGLSHVRPGLANQAFEALKPKFFCDGGRENVGAGYDNVGLMIYPPQKAKSPGEPTEAVAPTGNPQST